MDSVMIPQALQMNDAGTSRGRFLRWPYFSPDEIEAATAVLRSGKVNYWTGDECRLFEKEFSAAVGTTYAIALANGTVALEAALVALGIGPGDEVVVTSRTFVASASCVVMRGAKPVMADVDRASQNITAETIEAVLTTRTKAIIVVHLAGWPCDMDSIMALAEKRGLFVIEDCAQAVGAMYRGRPVGSIGHVAAFSFCQDKIMTTAGEGGMLTTNDASIWSKAWSFKDHGKSYDRVCERNGPKGFRWLHESFGTNWRMTEIQAAIGRAQLRKLPDWIRVRRKNAAILTQCFSAIPALRVTLPPVHADHAYYKYYTFVIPEALRAGWDRDRIMLEIEGEGVPCQVGSCSEIYMEKAFEAGGLKPGRRHPVARALGETSLMFLVHPTLSADDMKSACSAIQRVLSRAVR